MTLVVRSERWCETVVARSVTSGNPIRCARVATSLCTGCEVAVCEDHERYCKECQQSFCPRCDHVCAALPQEVA